MADDFDDDFGGFEAADPNETITVDSQPTPAFLLSSISALATNTNTPNISGNNDLDNDIPVDLNTSGVNEANSTSDIVTTSSSTPPIISEIDWGATALISWQNPLQAPSSNPVEEANKGTNTTQSSLSSVPDRKDDVSTDTDSLTSKVASINSAELVDLKNQMKLAQMRERQLQEELELSRGAQTANQEAHSQQIEALKQSQNSVLHLLIDQHKVDCQRAVTETQVKCTSEFRLIIEQAVDKFDAILQTQANQMEEWKTRQEMENKAKIEKEVVQLKDVIQGELTAHKSELEVKYNELTDRMDEEQLKMKDEINQHIETQKSDIHNQLQIELKEMLEKAILAQSTDIEKLVKTSIDSQQAIAMTFWTEQSGQTLELAESHIQRTLDGYKSAMEQYVEQRLQMDADQRNSQVAAVDVYLETAREHLKSLLSPSLSKTDSGT